MNLIGQRINQSPQRFRGFQTNFSLQPIPSFLDRIGGHTQNIGHLLGGQFKLSKHQSLFCICKIRYLDTSLSVNPEWALSNNS